MSKKLLLFIAVVIVSIPSVAFAQTESASVNSSTLFKTQAAISNTNREAEKALMKTKMEGFKQQIQGIKDARKKTVVQRIDDRVATANARLTNKMTGALSRMTSIINKLKAQSSALKTGGKDTGALDGAIAAAETAIATAQTQVTNQAQKVYSANITDDLTLKTTIGQMVSTFRTDISAVHKAVADARQAVLKAILELGKLKGTGDIKASDSANIH